MKKDWVPMLQRDKNYHCYVRGCPSWKMAVTGISDMVFRVAMFICICGLVGILATGYWFTGLTFFLGGLISMLSLWFRQLMYFHIDKNYKTVTKWHYDRMESV